MKLEEWAVVRRARTPNDEVHLDAVSVSFRSLQDPTPHQYPEDGVPQPETPKAGEGSGAKHVVSVHLCKRQWKVDRITALGNDDLTVQPSNSIGAY